MATEAVRVRQHTLLVLGGSLRSFLDQLGLASTGSTEGTIRRLREQMTRLFMARMVVVGGTDHFEAAEAVGILRPSSTTRPSGPWPSAGKT
jgi:hypothetical protein